MDENKLNLIYTTMPSSASAEELATQLVELDLSVCVNIFPAGKSIYKWQEKIEHSQECYLMIKAAIDKTDQLLDWLKKHHSYDAPALLTWQVHAHKP